MLTGRASAHWLRSAPLSFSPPGQRALLWGNPFGVQPASPAPFTAAPLHYAKVLRPAGAFLLGPKPHTGGNSLGVRFWVMNSHQSACRALGSRPPLTHSVLLRCTPCVSFGLSGVILWGHGPHLASGPLGGNVRGPVPLAKCLQCLRVRSPAAACLLLLGQGFGVRHPAFPWGQAFVPASAGRTFGSAQRLPAAASPSRCPCVERCSPMLAAVSGFTQSKR
ncbi:hypothetical protein Dred_0519 [Desulforamulus reducens MI-1]|uniref:Uncharacterized protein n=1 Tax=Desulforamulus reducens (strain ATCC BAA-1160 / DSM 100696 / MI-1) TaxID=349161 RepID=A4J1W1_DESRM|nr:hypothetical protein Dred_0519 [Desulforamulus reducens MI-1]